MSGEYSILIVDDIGTVRSLLHQTLIRFGLSKIDEAASAQSCLEKVSNQYDLIFLDIELPDGDGSELIHDINEISPSTNVVMISAHSTLENVKGSIERGAKGFVVKPFSPEKIAGVLKKLLPKP
jgi:two-component system chemotaxis response regulator CheY